MKRLFVALVTSFGIAAGSLGLAAAPAAAAVSPPAVATDVPVQLVKHWPGHHKRWVCRTHWVKKKLWRQHHWVWIKVPKRHCGWVWWGRPHPLWW